MQKLPKDKLDQSAAATLVTADVIAVEQMVSLFYEVWSSTILVGLGTWALYLFVGAACFLMLVPSACMSPCMTSVPLRVRDTNFSSICCCVALPGEFDVQSTQSME